MISAVRPSCATCQWFSRFQPADVGERVRAIRGPDHDEDDTEEDPEGMLEYGRCIRNPPAFFYETLNGEWPVIHESKVCGEYRVTNNHPYV